MKGKVIRLWNAIRDKYGYHGRGTHHNPVNAFMESMLSRYAYGISDGYFSPITRGCEPHRSIRCRICGRPVCFVVANTRFIGDSGDPIGDFEDKTLFGPVTFRDSKRCNSEQCESIADWDAGWSTECTEARRLKVKPREKEFKKAPAAIAYLDFKARLEAAKARSLSTV